MKELRSSLALALFTLMSCAESCPQTPGSARECQPDTSKKEVCTSEGGIPYCDENGNGWVDEGCPGTAYKLECNDGATRRCVVSNLGLCATSWGEETCEHGRWPKSTVDSCCEAEV